MLKSILILFLIVNASTILAYSSGKKDKNSSCVEAKCPRVDNSRTRKKIKKGTDFCQIRTKTKKGYITRKRKVICPSGRKLMPDQSENVKYEDICCK